MIRFDLRSILCAGITATALSLTTGCGVQTVAGPTDTPLSAIGGIAHGGMQAIQGGTVTLYATQSNGYGGAALPLAPTTTTDTNGGFTLAPNVACPAGQYAYITIAGGNTGGASVNSNSLLMTALGKCSDLYGGTNGTTYSGQFVWVDELTTVAAAYALDNFTTVSGSGATAVVNISAPVNNTATYSATTPSAGGLAHAFTNALALVNPFSGQPYATYNNKSGYGVIPDAEIFLLGNILQSCVNSTGVTGTNTATANDGTPCGKLFSMTTPPVSGASTPTDTMSAMLNLAHYPNPKVNTWSTDCTAAGGGTTTATSCLFSLATAQGAYGGTITSVPADWALAVVWQTGFGVQTGANCSGTTCSGINYPYHVALDYQDNIYVLNTDSSTGTFSNILGLGPDTTPLFATANDTTYSQLKQISTDLAGHVMGINDVLNSTGNNMLRVYSTTSGTLVASVQGPTSSPLNTAVDPYNNVFYISSASGGSLRRFTYGGTSSAPTYTSVSLTPIESQGALQLVLDANLNAYVEEQSSSGTFKVDFAANTGTYAAPTYTSAFYTASVSASTNVLTAFGIVPDASGNAYAGSQSGLFKITKTVGPPITIAAGSAIPLPITYGSALYLHYLYLDGAGNIITPDNANGTYSGVAVYDVADGGVALGTYKGCYVTTNTSSQLVCGTGASTSPIFSPRGAAIDSAGDVWVVSGAAHTLTMLVGAAAPTWPALSMVKFGKPQ
jgi:hypothetical protein